MVAALKENETTLAASNASPDAPVIVYVSKMIAVPATLLPRWVHGAYSCKEQRGSKVPEAHGCEEQRRSVVPDVMMMSWLPGAKKKRVGGRKTLKSMHMYYRLLLVI
eukprot:1137061-Pelagomonas_calceolata.AAC.5